MERVQARGGYRLPGAGHNSCRRCWGSDAARLLAAGVVQARPLLRFSAASHCAAWALPMARASVLAEQSCCAARLCLAKQAVPVVERARYAAWALPMARASVLAEQA